MKATECEAEAEHRTTPTGSGQLQHAEGETIAANLLKRTDVEERDKEEKRIKQSRVMHS